MCRYVRPINRLSLARQIGWILYYKICAGCAAEWADNMQYCVGLLDSGNYVFNLCRHLENKGHVFEVVSTPCQIAKTGCGYSLKFPEEFTELVCQESKLSGYPVRAVYKIVPLFSKNKYERIM